MRTPPPATIKFAMILPACRGSHITSLIFFKSGGSRQERECFCKYLYTEVGIENTGGQGSGPGQSLDCTHANLMIMLLCYILRWQSPSAAKPWPGEVWQAVGRHGGRLAHHKVAGCTDR